jgi:threonine dehydrogenase-like Zn-dependent dehydrogenase
MTTMQGLTFPGDSRAALATFAVPEAGPSQVVIRIKASGLCGSDLHSYHAADGLRAPGTGEHIVAGHEPCGVVEAVGSAVTTFAPGDRVLAYHILGCGYCHNCRLGFQVSCTSPARAAYGGQRNGGHGEFMLAEDRSLIRLPEAVSFIDGAMVACGFSTAYAATRRAGVRAGDRVVITGLGPVGTAAAMICADLGAEVIGVDLNAERAAAAQKLGVTHALSMPGELEALEAIREITAGHGVDAAIECSGSDQGRHLCLAAAAVWGHVVYVGFGGSEVAINAPKLIIQKQLTLRGSWVSSMAEMEEAVRLIAHRDLHPDSMISRIFSLSEGAEAYKLFAAGAVGKFAIVS